MKLYEYFLDEFEIPTGGVTRQFKPQKGEINEVGYAVFRNYTSVDRSFYMFLKIDAKNILLFKDTVKAYDYFSFPNRFSSSVNASALFPIWLSDDMALSLYIEAAEASGTGYIYYLFRRYDEEKYMEGYYSDG